jgi:hypothetical protein
MSGLEIVGAVLGAFPIAITLLEKYREIGQTFNFWWAIRREYRKCRQDLNYHRLVLQGSLKQMLLPLAVDDDTIKTMLDEPTGEAWSDPDILQQLRQRLAESFELCLEIVDAMMKTMKEVEKELALDQDAVQEQLLNEAKVRIRCTS